MKRVIGILVVMGVSVLLGGCGGGGGGSSDTAMPLQSTVRQMQAGDQWNYAVTGSVSDGTDTVNITGDLALTWGAQTVTTPGGVTAHVALMNITLTSEGETISSWDRSYETQDASGTILCYGGEDSDGVYWVTTPAAGWHVDMPSPMSQGTSWGDYVVYSNGESHNHAHTVVGTETVSVPAGRFETYKTTGNGIFGGYPATVTEWMAPQIGAFVQGNAVATDATEGLTLTVAYRLVSKTRSLAAEPKGDSRDLWEWARAVLRNAK